jgi:hypothetical protein
MTFDVHALDRSIHHGSDRPVHAESPEKKLVHVPDLAVPLSRQNTAWDVLAGNRNVWHGDPLDQRDTTWW